MRLPDQAGHAARPVRGGRPVVLGDGAAAGDAAVQVHLRQAGLQNVAADIVEIDVDALRRRRLERLEHAAGLVVDRRIEAELAREPVALVAPAGDADHAAALDLADLATSTDRAGRGGEPRRSPRFRESDCSRTK